MQSEYSKSHFREPIPSLNEGKYFQGKKKSEVTFVFNL